MTTGGRRTAFLVAGEASGDRLGAALCRALRASDPDLSLRGVGGPLMEAAGCEIAIPMGDLMVTGLFEVAGSLPRIYRILRRLRRLLASPDRPDVLVLIDYQDFNTSLAGTARRLGVPVLFYVSPQVWAWRPDRARKLAARVDRLAVVFPFELDYYRGLDIEVRYVGHPLVEELEGLPNGASVRRRLGLEGARPVVGVFPGSRRNEIRYNLGTLLETARLLGQRYPEAAFLLPLAPGLPPSLLAPSLRDGPQSVRVLAEPLPEVARACDAVVTVAGTATLQTGLAGTPLAVMYRMSPLSYAVLRRMVRLPRVGLVNIAAGRAVAREFIQAEATPEALAAEVVRILEDVAYRGEMVRGLTEMRARMGGGGGSARVAAMVSEMSRGKRRSAECRVPST